MKLPKFKRIKSYKFLYIPLLVIVAVTSFTFLTKNDTQAWYSDNWAFRKKLTVDSDQVSGSSNLENFPVLVSLSSDTNLSTNAQDDGDDILFTDKNGNKLDHEIESYSSGTLVAWVRIPSLSPTTDTDIYMYYGNPGADNQENATGVWDEDYKGVWHLNETATDEETSATHNDSTSNANNGTQNGNSSTNGKMGIGQEFDGTDDFINAGTSPSLSNLESMTITMWVYSHNFDSNGRFISKANNGNTAGWFFANTTSGRGRVLFRVQYSNADLTNQTDNDVYDNNKWNFIAVTWDGSNTGTNIHIYEAGQEANNYVTNSNAVGSRIDDSALSLLIGSGNLEGYLDGIIDEVRITNKVRTPDWLTTEYANQNDPSGFFSVSSQQQRTRGPVAYWAFNEGYGTTVMSSHGSSGGSPTGTLGTGSSAPTWKDESMCMNGKCLQFDGSNDYITVSDNNNLDLTNEGTIQAWVKPNNTTAGVGGTIPSWTSLTAPDGANEDDSAEIDTVLVGDKLYYAAYLHTDDTEYFRTAYSDLDGGNFSGWTAQTAPDGAPTASTNTSGTSVGIDSDGTSLYYAALVSDGFTEKFYTTSSNLTGSSFTPWTVQTAPEGCGPTTACAVDLTVVGSKMYFSALMHVNNSTEPDFYIASANLDGTGFSGWSEKSPPFSTGYPNTNIGIAVDSDGEQLYFAALLSQTTNEFYSIARSNLDGTNFSGWTAVNAPNGNNNGDYYGTDLVVVGNKIYYAAYLHNATTESYLTAYSDLNGNNFSSWTQHAAPDGAANKTTTSTSVVSDGKKLYYNAFTFTGTTEYFYLASQNLPSYQSIISKQGAYELIQNGGGFVFDWAGVPYSFGDIDSSYWNHVAIANDGSNLKIYVNGELKRTQSTTVDFTSNSNAVNIGGNGSRYYNGFIDEVKIYPYARSEDEIKQDYASISTRGAGVVLGSDPSSQGRTLSNGLVGYWNMEGIGSTASGQTVIDRSGNGNNGTTDDGANNTGMNCTVAGKYGGGCTFDGSDDYIEKTSPSNLPLGGTDRTVSVWFKTSSSNNTFETPMVSYGTNSLSFGIAISSGTVAIAGGGSSYGRYGSSIIDGQWHHVVAIVKPSYTTVATTLVYVDGVQRSFVGGNNETTAINTATGDLRIGREVGDNKFFIGTVDEVRIYNRALSASEVQALYKWAPGPVAYYNFDEGSGTTLNDRSGNGNTGTITDAQWTTGNYGKALTFDGDDDYVTVSDQDLFSFGNGVTDNPFTIEAWIKTDRTDGNQRIVAKQGSSASGGEYSFTIGSVGGGLSLFITDTSANAYLQRYTGNIISTGTWYHVAAVYDGSASADGIKLYVNGIRKDTNSTVSGTYTAMENTSTNVRIGTNNNLSGDFDGEMDEVRIYNYARTQEQILEDMNAGHPAVGTPIGSTVLHLSFDEGYGSTAHDKSPQGNNGTLGTGSSAPTWTNNGKFGKALSFDGSNDYVSIGSTASLQIQQFTMSTWINFDTINTQDNFINNQNVIFYQTGNGSLYGYINSANRVNTSAGIISAGQWYHVALTYDGTKAKIYLNGSEKASSDYSATINYTNNATIGVGPSGGHPFDGRMDEVKIYPFALSADQVAAEYNQGKTIVLGSTSVNSSNTPLNSSSSSYCVPGSSDTCNPPVFEMDFENKSGTTYYDTSGNGNNGTASGNPTYRTPADCKVGNCLEFDGSDDGVSTSSTTTMDDLSALTLSAWVNTSVDKNKKIFHKAAGNDTSGWSFSIPITAAGRLAFTVDYSTTDLSVHSSDFMVPTTGWHHVALTWDGSTTASNVKMYVDGVETTYASQQNASGTRSSDSGKEISIGYNGGSGDRFIGLLDQMKIYNYVRTPAQIAWEYNKGAPIAHYKLDECQGTTAYDSSGNGNHGTITAGATGNTSAGTCDSGSSTQMWANGANGKFNASLDFDGVSDYIDLGTGQSLTTGFTLSAWIKAHTHSGTDMIVGRTRSGVPFPHNYYLQLNAGKLQLGFYNGSSFPSAIESNVSMQTGTWYHVLGTYTDGVITIYINGKQVAQNSSAGTPSPGVLDTMTLSIGANAEESTSYFDGQIDDVRIYNYALTEAQIKNIYNGGSAIRFD